MDAWPGLIGRIGFKSCPRYQMTKGPLVGPFFIWKCGDQERNLVQQNAPAFWTPACLANCFVWFRCLCQCGSYRPAFSFIRLGHVRYGAIGIQAPSPYADIAIGSKGIAGSVFDQEPRDSASHAAVAQRPIWGNRHIRGAGRLEPGRKKRHLIN